MPIFTLIILVISVLAQKIENVYENVYENNYNIEMCTTLSTTN